MKKHILMCLLTASMMLSVFSSPVHSVHAQQTDTSDSAESLSVYETEALDSSVQTEASSDALTPPQQFRISITSELK